MEVLDRYLKAVKFWLPKEHKEDVVAELSDDIRSQIEEKEEELGRPLEKAEVEAILKKGGPPMLVAGRYMPQRYLIGPALFPMYWFVLKLGWTCFFGPWLIVGICLQVFAAVSGNSSPVIAKLLDPFFRSVLINFVTITIVFALIDRHNSKSGFLGDRDARRTPVARDPNRIPRGASIGEWSWDAMLLLWWVNVLHIPRIPGLEITASPIILRFFYWPILFLLVCQGTIAIFNTIRPQWTPGRAGMRGMVNGFSALVVYALLVIWLTGGTFVVVNAAKLSAAQIASFETWSTFGWSVMLLIWAAASYTARLVQDTKRAMGKQPPHNWALRLLTGE